MVETSNGEVYEAWRSVLSAHSEDAIATTVFIDNLTKVFTHEITVDEYMDMIGAEMGSELISDIAPVRELWQVPI